MKKFLYMCLAALLMPSVFTSCEGAKPGFTFQLNLTGDVVCQGSVSGDFAVNATNVQPDSIVLNNYFAVNDAHSLSAPEGEKANDWLDQYIERNVISYFDPKATYDIYIKGYIKESLTGITFQVDKRITNKTN